MSDWYFLRDGGQFGPLSWQDLWRHGQKGELRPADLVWTEGMPEWRQAASIPGLFPAAPQPPQVQPQPAPVPQQAYAPAPQAAPAPAPQASPYYPQPQASPQPVPQRPIGDDPLMRMVLPVGRSAWAIAAGYLGLLSFLVVFAPLALAAGIFALVDIKQNPHKHGKGRAIFGIVMGALGSILLVAIIVAVTMEK